MKNRPSIVKHYKMLTISILLAFVLIMIIGPFIIYVSYVREQNNLLRVELPSVGASFNDIIKLSTDDGFKITISEMDLQSFISLNKTCTVEEYDYHLGYTDIKSSSCPTLRLSVNTSLLDGYIHMYVIYSFALLFIVQISLYVTYKVFKIRLEETVLSINDQVIKIRKLGNSVDNYLEFEYYTEFAEIFEQILFATTALKISIDDKYVLTQTLNHELKTPINKISSILQAHEYQMPGYEDASFVMQKVDEELKNMTEIIDYSLKVFTFANEKKVQFQLDELIKNEIKMRSQKSKIRNLTFDIDVSGDTKMYCEREKLKLVVSNIIENTVKYSLENSCVLIKIRGSEFEVENKIDFSISSGTQKGLKLTDQILATMGYKINYKNDGQSFWVNVSRQE